jgi:hypothetical protein
LNPTEAVGEVGFLFLFGLEELFDVCGLPLPDATGLLLESLF